jgi:hypothetical protein
MITLTVECKGSKMFIPMPPDSMGNVPRYCKDSVCGKLLVQREGEHNYNFMRRQHCGVECTKYTKKVTQRSKDRVSFVIGKKEIVPYR